MHSSRPIWKGSISFGLVMIPVTLFPTDNHTALHFHLLDKRNNARIRYERINEETGKPVPWHEVAKAYEFEKGNYVIIDELELEKTAYKNYDSIEIENFLDKNAIDSLYFEKAYYLSPGKQGIKGYALLHKALEMSKKIGIAKVVIRSRQHLAAVMPFQNILVLNLLRFPEEVKNYKEFQIPENDIKTYKLSAKEIEMADRLVKSMSGKWDPKQYHDENRELLQNWIDKKIKSGKSIAEPTTEKTKQKQKSGKVIDFMALLKKSIQEKERKASKPRAGSKSTVKKSALNIKNRKLTRVSGSSQGKNKKKREKK